MAVITTTLESRDTYAYDLHTNIISKGEALDDEAINVSIENILTTYYGERVFNPYFGCDLPMTVFENMVDETEVERLIENIIESIERWEDRIILIKSKIIVKIVRNDNSMELHLPYIIKNSQLTSSYDKRIIF